MSELVNAFFTLNFKNAMGDFIHNKFLSNFSKSLYTFLLSAINSSRFFGRFHDFKSSILLSILKSGRYELTSDESLPISLLSCLDKLIEKIVYNRLYSHFENNNLLPKSHCGFRKKRSCIDIPLYLENYIQLALRTVDSFL